MKPEVSISTGGKKIPLDPLQVSFLHHMTRFQPLQVSFLTPVAPVLSIYRCRFYTTPTLPPCMPFLIPSITPLNRARPKFDLFTPKPRRALPEEVTMTFKDEVFEIRQNMILTAEGLQAVGMAVAFGDSPWAVRAAPLQRV